jgi:hypothetical protein
LVAAESNLTTLEFRLVAMRIIALLGCLALTACGGGAGAGQVCTGIGTPVGIGLDVQLANVSSATMEVCWDGRCVEPAVELYPSSSAGPETCTGTSPSDSCGVSMVPAGGQNGFASVADLPAKPVAVTLRLFDGKVSLVDQHLTVTPKMLYPNGEQCGAGGPQTGLVVSPAGSVAER